MALTSSESEFYLRSCKRDLLFLIFFTFLGINIKLHVKVKADNLRAVYKSRQMDTRFNITRHFMRAWSLQQDS